MRKEPEMRPGIDLRAGVVKHKVAAPMLLALAIIVAAILVCALWWKPRE